MIAQRPSIEAAKMERQQSELQKSVIKEVSTKPTWKNELAFNAIYISSWLAQLAVAGVAKSLNKIQD